jgi:hypothetical protein
MADQFHYEILWSCNQYTVYWEKFIAEKEGADLVTSIPVLDSVRKND